MGRMNPGRWRSKSSNGKNRHVFHSNAKGGEIRARRACVRYTNISAKMLRRGFEVVKHPGKIPHPIRLTPDTFSPGPNLQMAEARGDVLGCVAQDREILLQKLSLRRSRCLGADIDRRYRLASSTKNRHSERT